MNTNTKRELEALLAEALASLTIQYGQSQQLSLARFRAHLQICRSVYSPDEKFLVSSSRLEITSTEVKQKVLDIMNRELADLIREGKIHAATIAFAGGMSDGSPIDKLLRNLLMRAILDGPAKAVQAFADCQTNSSCIFHRFFLITGVSIPKPVEIFDGITLIPLPESASQLPPYIPYIRAESDRFRSTSIKDILGKTLVRVEYEVSPIFHKPEETYTFQSGPEEHFKIKLKGEEIPDPNLDVLCQALSVAGRCRVKSVLTWTSLLDYEIFDLKSILGIGGSGYSEVEADHIFDELVPLRLPQLEIIKTIYRGITELPTGTWEKLRIPIDRWAKSMAEENPIDQIIDLGIALESLYVPESQTEVSLRLALHAAWHLGENKTRRLKLRKDFQLIYRARSDVVHTGKLRPKTVKSMSDVPKFVSRVQEFCRQGITKVIEAGEIPKWEDLIMGEDLD